ncbi:MAG: 16S rRNA (cytosine(1402)-N(4))-methyltransferase RsmH [Desulfovibrio sp.]|nr:16S rRNA (cytosine(1402)-N(4))-methyltransferase RsmH [Desulfovibrio sp.]
MEQHAHKPVLLARTLEFLNPSGQAQYLDGTVGLGGHAGAILASCPECQLCGLDQDEEALAIAEAKLAEYGRRAQLFHLRYADFPKALATLGWDRIDGCLLDLGVSSLQLDAPERGFSFRSSGPLDMRMDASFGGRSCRDLVNRATFAELRDCIARLGEEPQASRIAARIVKDRQKQPIEDTLQLAKLVCQAYPPKWRRSARRHPATRTFQALRMAVNGELEQLETFLEAIPQWLGPGARMVVISFHSLEDRLVKRAFRAWAEAGRARLLTRKPLQAQEEELAVNPRASSAKLRAIEII